MTDPRRRLTLSAQLVQHPVAPVAMAVLFVSIMIPAWVDAIGRVEPRGQAQLAGVGAAVYGLACIAAVPATRAARLGARTALCLALLALGAGLVALVGVSSAWLALGALGVTAVLLSWRATAALTLLTVAAIVVATAAHGSTEGLLGNVAVIVSVTAATGMLVGLSEANDELRRARDDTAALAVYRERERVARDLHDILGHSLTTITVKAGLARRVAEEGDARRAATEMHDVERLARQALTDVRGTVEDFRQVALAGEMAAAGQVLRAAEIVADLPRAVDDVVPELHAVFGYVLREATTNTVRHARAGHFGVQLGPTWIEVEDDGTPACPGRYGNGLRGLEERLAAIGGRFEAGPRVGGGWRVYAEAPAAGAADTDAAGARPAVRPPAEESSPEPSAPVVSP